MSDAVEIESMIRQKGLDAPRLSPEDIEDVISQAVFHRLTDVLTVCVITLVNGFEVTGESACASPENYNQEIGEKIAYTNAADKIWMLEGYLLKESLFQDALNAKPPGQ